MTRITSIETDWINVHFDTKFDYSFNQITLLTGPNGSGKTQVLSSAARSLLSRVSPREGDQREVVHTSGHCSRVITQTFSPFSRFPPARKTLRPESFFSFSEMDYYICIGISRTKLFAASTLTKNTLEEALFRLAESPNVVFGLFRVIQNLGYRGFFRIEYKARSHFRELREAYLERGYTALRARLFNLKSLAFLMGDKLGSKAPLDELTELLASAFDVVRDFQVSESGFELSFDYFERNTNDYAAFQSFALLRRLGLFGLSSFYLFDEAKGREVDVSHASSGQQQMLCSMLSLASALKDNCIVLIDEPELSLHPTWQYLYVDGLRAVLKEFQGCHVIVATHSPLIVQQGKKYGAEIRSLDNPYINRIGIGQDVKEQSSVEGTLLDVFGTPVVDSVYLANEIFSAVVSAENDSVSRSESKAKLVRLLDIYSNPISGDHKSVELIIQAIECLDDLG